MKASLVFFFFQLIILYPVFSQALVGTWNLEEGKYNNSVIQNLSSELIITDINASDSLNYFVTFTDSVSSGSVDARYTLEDDKFISNLNNAQFALNGFSSSSAAGPNGVQTLWLTFLQIPISVFNQWGGTIIGFGSPTFSVDGTKLTLESQDGKTILIYDKMLSHNAAHLSAREDITLFPNPSRGQVLIRGEDMGGNWDLVLFNSQGQIIRRAVWNANYSPELPINLRSLPVGIYCLKGRKGKEFFTKRLVLQ